MSVEVKNLHKEVIGQGISIWSYRTKHKAEDLLESGYWSMVAGRLRLGDRIHVLSTGRLKVQGFTLVVTRQGRSVLLEPENPPPVQ